MGTAPSTIAIPAEKYYQNYDNEKNYTRIIYPDSPPPTRIYQPPPPAEPLLFRPRVYSSPEFTLVSDEKSFYNPQTSRIPVHPLLNPHRWVQVPPRLHCWGQPAPRPTTPFISVSTPNELGRTYRPTGPLKILLAHRTQLKARALAVGIEGWLPTTTLFDTVPPLTHQNSEMKASGMEMEGLGVRFFGVNTPAAQAFCEAFSDAFGITCSLEDPTAVTSLRRSSHVPIKLSNSFEYHDPLQVPKEDFCETGGEFRPFSFIIGVSRVIQPPARDAPRAVVHRGDVTYRGGTLLSNVPRRNGIFDPASASAYFSWNNYRMAATGTWFSDIIGSSEYGTTMSFVPPPEANGGPITAPLDLSATIGGVLDNRSKKVSFECTLQIHHTVLVDDDPFSTRNYSGVTMFSLCVPDVHNSSTSVEISASIPDVTKSYTPSYSTQSDLARLASMDDKLGVVDSPAPSRLARLASPVYSAIHAAAGATGGCVAMAITYPLVNLSTRAQVTAKKGDETIKSAALKVIKEDGLAGLYDGLTSSLIGIAITNGIYYLFFEETRAVLLKAKKSKATLSTLESILASSIAGAATSILSNPIWVINTRQTVRTTVAPSLELPSANPGDKIIVEKKLGILQTILHILKTDGWTAFFKGLGPALMLVSNPILQYTLFEQLKNLILKRRSLRLTKGALVPLTDLDFFLLGAVSKLFATATTYPYLTVKARMQANNAEGKSYTSAFDGLQKIIKKEGVQGLYKGVGPKLTQSVATAAILFLAKEKFYQATVKALGTVATVA
ncbi:peroxisomal membrane protein Pmp47 [Pseudohyphozyma bogoriensis]|nr:peroxisomal membrane protein Pmp47 [Pseudohyphozyma bogoriensis]